MHSSNLPRFNLLPWNQIQPYIRTFRQTQHMRMFKADCDYSISLSDNNNITSLTYVHAGNWIIFDSEYPCMPIAVITDEEHSRLYEEVLEPLTPEEIANNKAYVEQGKSTVPLDAQPLNASYVFDPPITWFNYYDQLRFILNKAYCTTDGLDPLLNDW